jgi:hypothetical protein
VIHDVAVVEPVGLGLVALLLLVDAGGQQNRVHRQEQRQFPYQGVKIGFSGCADGGFDQAMQPLLARLLLLEGPFPLISPDPVPGERRAGERGYRC